MIKKFCMPVLLLAAVACASSPSDGYERHSLSRLVVVEGSASEFIFEVGPPPSDPAEAEAVRMRWLSEWLALRGLCMSGHEIIDKRPFGPFEYNPMRAEFRYLVRCRAVQPAEKEGQ